MASINLPEDLCNEALRAVGFGRAVGDLYEGSPQARACLEVYAQTRDEILATDDAKSFNRGVAALVLLKGPPPMGGYSAVQPWSTIYPPPGYLYEYAQPADMIEMRAIISTTSPLPIFDPQPETWRIDDDLLPIVSGSPAVASGPPQTVILANLSGAVAVYRRRVTDLTLWKPAALAAFIARMAAKLSTNPALAASPQIMQAAPAEAVYAANVARGHRG